MKKQNKSEKISKQIIDNHEEIEKNYELLIKSYKKIIKLDNKLIRKNRLLYFIFTLVWFWLGFLYGFQKDFFMAFFVWDIILLMWIWGIYQNG